MRWDLLFVESEREGRWSGRRFVGTFLLGDKVARRMFLRRCRFFLVFSGGVDCGGGYL